MKTTHLLAALGLAMSLAAQSGRVWRVAPSGGDFTEIQPAVDAASSGDTILVASQAGTYRAFGSPFKALTIMAADAVRPTVLGRNSVDLLSGQTFTLAGLVFQARDMAASIPPDAHAIRCVGPTGSTVVIRNCRFDTGRGDWSRQPPLLPSGALTVDTDTAILQDVDAVGYDQAGAIGIRARTVSLVRCSARGGDTRSCFLPCIPPANAAGAMGLQPPLLGTGTFVLSEVSCAGGDVPSTSRSPSLGGDGLVTEGLVTVFVFGRTGRIVGGHGTDYPGSTGGNGLHNYDGLATVYVDGSPFVGGAAGGPSGSAGQAVFNATPIPRLLAALWTSPALVDRGTSTQLSLLARQQEPHVVFAGAPVPWLGAPVPEPVFLFGGGLSLLLAVLFTDQNGAAGLSLPVPNDPNLLSLSLAFQGFGISAGQQLVVGNASGVTVR